MQTNARGHGRNDRSTLLGASGLDTLRRWLVLAVLLAAARAALAAGGESEEYDSYKLRFDLFWFYSQPSGHFTSAGNTGHQRG